MSVDKLRAAFWCRHLFNVWGVSNPKQLEANISKTASMNGEPSIAEKLYRKYKDSSNSEIAEDVFLNSDNRKWVSYYSGARSPSKELISKISTIVPTSQNYYLYGPCNLFSIFDSANLEEAVFQLKDALVEYVSEQENEILILESEVKVSGTIEDAEFAPSTTKITLQDIEKAYGQSLLKAYKALGNYLPDITPFHAGTFPTGELDKLYFHIGYQAISAKFLTDEYSYLGLAKLLFMEGHVNLIEIFENRAIMPKQLWFEIDFVQEAKTWLDDHVSECSSVN